MTEQTSTAGNNALSALEYASVWACSLLIWEIANRHNFGHKVKQKIMNISSVAEGAMGKFLAEDEIEFVHQMLSNIQDEFGKQTGSGQWNWDFDDDAARRCRNTIAQIIPRRQPQ